MPWLTENVGLQADADDLAELTVVDTEVAVQEKRRDILATGTIALRLLLRLRRCARLASPRRHLPGHRHPHRESTDRPIDRSTTETAGPSGLHACPLKS